MALALVGTWGVGGLLVGVLARFVTKGGSYGRRWDVLPALIGSFAGSGRARPLEIPAAPSPVAVIVAAAVPATGLIVAQRKIWPIIAVGARARWTGEVRTAMATADPDQARQGHRAGPRGPHDGAATREGHRCRGRTCERVAGGGRR